MKLSVALIAALPILVATAFAQPQSKELKGKSKGHVYRVIFKVRDFKADGRKIAFKPDPYKALAAENILIDGVGVYGFDGIPKEWAPKGTTARKVLESRATEISQFDVWIDGKRIPIPHKRYEMALMPDLTSAKALFSDDGKTFFIILSGADGAAFWTARWVIEKGKVNVEIGAGG